MQYTDDELVLKEICHEVERGNTDKVRTLLQTTRRTAQPPEVASKYLDNPLLPETVLASKLRTHLLSKGSSLSPKNVLRALLCVPGSYETPWNAAVDLVVALQGRHWRKNATGNHESNRTEWTSVAEVQSFLQQTVASWWKMETLRTTATRVLHPAQANTATSTGTTTTPRQCLESLVKAALKPLFVDESSPDDVPSSDNSHWMLPLELVTTTVSYLQDVDSGPETKGSIAGWVRKKVLQSRRIRPDRLLPWWTLALDVCQDSNGCISEQDAVKMAATLQQSWQDMPEADLPGMVRTVASLVVSKDHRKTSVSTKWQSILLELLHMASHDASTYSTVETVLKSRLEAMTTPLLLQWKASLDTLQTTEKIPPWVLVNVHLLLLQTVQRSGSQMVSNLVAQSLKQSTAMTASGDLTQQCWLSLLQLFFRDAKRPTRRGRPVDVKAQSKKVVDGVQTILLGVVYQGEGRFVREDDNEATMPFSLLLLCQSIFLGRKSHDEMSHQFFAAERAQVWVSAANAVLCSPSAPAIMWTTEDMLLVVLIVVCVYLEVPASRKTLVRTMVQMFTQQEVPHCLQKLLCLALSVIVRSICRSNTVNLDSTRELNSLTQIFSHGMPGELFQELASALSPLSLARHGLLSTCRKFLKSPFGGGIWWGRSLVGAHGAQEDTDRIHSAVYGLCTLLVAQPAAGITSWDDCAADAWVLLSDMIVLNKPVLAIGGRTRLYACIMRFTKSGSFAPETLTRLLRATVVRLLDFFEFESNTLLFDLDRVFSSWTSDDAGGLQHTVVKDDVSGIMRLLVCLMECDVIPGCGRIRRRCHDRMTAAILAHRTGSDLMLRMKPQEGPDWLEAEKGFLAHRAACSSMMAILDIVASQKKVVNEGPAASPTDIREEIVRELVLQETASCRMQHDVLPNWIKVRSPSSRGSQKVLSPDNMESLKVVSPIADVFIRILLSPRWSSADVDESSHDAKTAVLCVSSLVDIKRRYCGNLSTHTAAGRVTNGWTNWPVYKDVGTGFDSLFLEDVSAHFLGLSARLLGQAIRMNGDISETSAIFEASLVHCRAVSDLLVSQTSLSEAALVAITENLTKLYESAASEQSSKTLIEYLEENCLDDQPASGPQLKEKSLSLLNVRSDRDIDAFVRHVRLSIFGAFHACLVRVSKLAKKERPIGEATLDSLDISFWIECFDNLCWDAICGLEGESGGLSDKIYVTLLDIIDCVSSALSGLCTRGSVDVQTGLQLARRVRDNEKMLRTILFRYPLQAAGPFKKTILITAHTLPCLARCVSRMLYISNETADLASCESGDTAFSFEVLCQGRDILKHWMELGLKEDTPWGEIAGLDRLKPAGYRSDDGSSMDDRDGVVEIPSVVVIPAPKATFGFDSETDSKLKLPSKDTWSWSCCLALMAMEQNWMESHRNLLQMKPANQSHRHELQHLRRLVAYRQNALGSVLTSVMDLLARRSEATPPPQHSREIFATAFPDSVKIRLCSLLDRVTSTLLAAIRRVGSYSRFGRHEELPAVAEAVVCISSWLQSTSDGALDFIGGSRRWYSSEAKERPESPVLGRLPKVLYRMDELERSLQRLGGLLARSDIEPDADCSLRVQQLFSLLDSPAKMDDYTGPSSGNEMGSFTRKIREKASISAPHDGLGMIISGGSVGLAKKKRKRRTQVDTRLRQERRKRIVRSRNRLVDQWLNLDQENNEEGGLDDDAFVDLEDFLVDG